MPGMTPAIHVLAVLRAAITGFKEDPPARFIDNMMILESHLVSEEGRAALIPQLYGLVLDLWHAQPQSTATEPLLQKWNQRAILMFEGQVPSPRDYCWPDYRVEHSKRARDARTAISHDQQAGGFRTRALWVDSALKART